MEKIDKNNLLKDLEIILNTKEKKYREKLIKEFVIKYHEILIEDKKKNIKIISLYNLKKNLLNFKSVSKNELKETQQLFKNIINGKFEEQDKNQVKDIILAIIYLSTIAIPGGTFIAILLDKILKILKIKNISNIEKIKEIQEKINTYLETEYNTKEEKENIFKYTNILFDKIRNKFMQHFNIKIKKHKDNKPRKTEEINNNLEENVLEKNFYL